MLKYGVYLHQFDIVFPDYAKERSRQFYNISCIIISYSAAFNEPWIASPKFCGTQSIQEGTVLCKILQLKTSSSSGVSLGKLGSLTTSSRAPFYSWGGGFCHLHPILAHSYHKISPSSVKGCMTGRMSFLKLRLHWLIWSLMMKRNQNELWEN